MHSGPQKQKVPVHIANLNKELKALVLTFFAVIAIGLAFTLGPALITLIYMGIVAAGVAAFAMYPKETDAYLKDKQLVILGACIGFFIGGPLGLVLGGWLSDFAFRQAKNIKEAAQSATSTVTSYMNPFSYFSGAWQGVKEACSHFAETLSKLEPNFTIAEDEADVSKSEESNGSESPDASEPSEGNLALATTQLQSSRADLNVAVALPPEQSYGLLSWFYSRFAILPPCVPNPLPQTEPADTDEETLSDTPEASDSSPFANKRNHP